MNELNYTEISDTNINFLAWELSRQPEKWVLFLGDKVSYNVKGSVEQNCQQFISEMAFQAMKREELSPDDLSKMYEAAQERKIDVFKTVLFGDMWDGALFVDKYREKQLERREKLAEALIDVAHVNVELARFNCRNKNDGLCNDKVDLTKILKWFNIILTTCQDETIEAFMEYERAMPIDEMDVCTPYSLMTSPKSRRRMDDFIKIKKYDMSKYKENGLKQVLFKINGSRNNAKRMLLSDWDIKSYYPEDYQAGDSKNDDSVKDNPPYTMVFLEKLLKGKNLLFIGMDPLKDIAPGIRNLLVQLSDSNLEKFVIDMETSKINDFLDCISKKAEEYLHKDDSDGNDSDDRHSIDKNPDGNNNENEIWDAGAAEKYFWSLYTRRLGTKIFSAEKGIIKDIFEGNGERKWNLNSVKMAALAANNLADFYDLEEEFNCEYDKEIAEETSKDTPDALEHIFEQIVRNRLDKESSTLFQFLCIYGDGFPSSFLSLLSSDKTDLNTLKRSAIHLVNCGLCSKAMSLS